MASNSIAAQVLMKKGKRGAADYVHANPQHLNELLDLILNPIKTIDEWETIDWIKWLMAGGRTPDEFTSIVLRYDNSMTCGLVWTANYVAYRCRTCGISPCMSLCAQCFQKGNHTGHDFNMFKSQAGGACDCGDISVMKETGFCERHGPKATVNKPHAPSDLMCVAEAIMPRIILRLIQHLRDNSVSGSTDSFLVAIQDADSFLMMLHEFSAMGAAMRRVMTGALTNPQIYKHLISCPSEESEYYSYMKESTRIYSQALLTMPNPEPPEEYMNCAPLQEMLAHRTFIEELMFWTVKYEFPQKMVCLLLNMLPDPDYKEALTQAFVLHYSRISIMLERSGDPDTLSNRVVHVSVQLFSNESLAFRMSESLNLLHVMVISLKYMMSKILVQNTLHDPKKNFHYVVDCGRQVMKEHCYWPLVSDLNNVLSHRPVAVKFMSDDNLLEMWFAFLSMFQGMNVNQREMTTHVEFEPNTYYAAFSAELEASAYPMWALVSHLTETTSVDLTKRVLASCLVALQDWLDAINYTSPHTVSMNDSTQVSFHLPLHRYFAVLMCTAIKTQGAVLRDVLPPTDVLQLIMMHPLRVQVAFYEVLSGMWVRNGLQIKGQAMTYIQCNFCNSMVDADLYLLQLCATQLPADSFLTTIIDKFHVSEWMSVTPSPASRTAFMDGGEQDTPMLESCLTFLASLMSIRTNLGETDASSQLEMVTLLCMGDKTHSQLIELMPERCGTAQSRDFEHVLSEVAEYKAPNLDASGNMQQGMYVPTARVWETLYDPIHVLLRAVHRRDFQTSMDRFTEYATQSGRMKGGGTPWPPFRSPTPVHPSYEDPRRIVRSRVFHAMTFVVLHKAVHAQTVSEHVMALAVYLLEMAIETAEPSDQHTQVCSASKSEREIKDKDLSSWYESDWLSSNLRTVINFVKIEPEPAVVFDSSDSEIEWETSEMEEGSSLLSDRPPVDPNALMLEGSSTSLALIVTGDRSVATTGEEDEDLTPSQDNQMVPSLPSSTSDHQIVPANNSGGYTPGSADADSPTTQMVPVGPGSPVDTSNQQMVPSGSSASAAPTAGQMVPTRTRGTSTSQQMVPTLTAGPSSSQQISSLYRQLAVRRPVRSETAGAAPSGSGPQRKGTFLTKRKQVTFGSSGSTWPSEDSFEVKESIISLLLKLHSHLAGVPDSFVAEGPEAVPDQSRVGDGRFFVGKVLNRIAALDSLCRENIRETRERLWPRKPEGEDEQKEREAQEREDRRRRAKEKQQKIMAEFASKQKLFMEKAMETDEDGLSGMEWSEASSTPLASKKEYDCVICNQTTPSTEDKPMGLVVLVQATSVLGHKRRHSHQAPLPTCEEERQQLRRDDRLAGEFDRRIEELNRQFDSSSWQLSVSVGWEGGVHLQTCGHHLHLDCLKSYLHSLRSAQRQQSIAVDRGEYWCPLCRQLANSVLPLSPELGECAAIVRSRPVSQPAIVNELVNFLKENPPSPVTSNLAEAMVKSMEEMTESTHHKYKQKSSSPSPQSLFLFVSSIARTNLEIELVQRGGSLCSIAHGLAGTSAAVQSASPDASGSLIPKRSCIVPLLHVLAMHARLLANWHSWRTLQQIAGIHSDPTPLALAPLERDVPLLLADPTALLTQYILLLPLHLDQTYFSCLVKVLYNLLYFQVVAQLSCRLGEKDRSSYRGRSPAQASAPLDSLDDAMTLTIRTLDQSQLYLEDDCSGGSEEGAKGSGSDTSLLTRKELELIVQKLCLPFLRVAALLRHHLYEQPLPEIAAPQSEFVRLVYYLELVTEGMDWQRFSAAVALNWSNDAVPTATMWLEEYSAFVNRCQIGARNFLVDQHLTWYQPRLLKLPELYDRIFQYYHEKQCLQCHSVPRETSICLLCGTLVCLKENCCKQLNVCEAIQHSVDCGGGTAMFLVVTSSYIIVVRGKRACLWGSLYLDTFGEEDRELKRGKPLELSVGRYQLLEQQWLAHRFDHTNKKWVWHRDAL